MKQLHGKGGLDRLVAAAPPVLAPVLREKISQSAWYPYEAYAALLRIIDRQLGVGDLAYCRKLGEWAGREDLGSMFKIYAMLASPERLIRSCKLVWPQYYDLGAMSALDASPESTRLIITDARAMDAAHCRLMEGWMLGTMAQIGCLVHDGAREVSCTSRGGPYHEFACTWDRA